MGKSAPIRAAATLPAQVTPFNFGDHAVRVAQDDHGQPWFVVADVAEALGYSSVKDAQRSLSPDEKGSHTVRTLGGDQRMTTVNEAGLYALILRSRKPSAKAFSRWLRGEVLPSLRKTGQYIVNSKQNQPLAGAESAQSATKSGVKTPPLLSFDPASLIGDGAPEVPDWVELDAELLEALNSRAVTLASECVPALRSYLRRAMVHQATVGSQPPRLNKAWALAALQSAGLAEALVYERSRNLALVKKTAANLTAELARSAKAIEDMPG